MSEYIERGALLAHIAGVKICLQGKGEWISGYHDALQAVGEMVQEFPAADVVGVKHGRWECVDFVSPTLKCSVCGGLAPMDCCGDYHGERTDYCPNCGAKMDGE